MTGAASGVASLAGDMASEAAAAARGATSWLFNRRSSGVAAPPPPRPNEDDSIGGYNDESGDMGGGGDDDDDDGGGGDKAGGGGSGGDDYDDQFLVAYLDFSRPVGLGTTSDLEVDAATGQAAAAGVTVGMLVLAVNGERVDDTRGLAAAIARSRGTASCRIGPVRVLLKR